MNTPEARKQIFRDARNGNDVAQFIAGRKLLLDSKEKQGMDFLHRSARQGNDLGCRLKEKLTATLYGN